MITLFRIEAPHFVAGLVLINGVVDHGAPILKYMNDWTFNAVIAYCNSKRWKYEWKHD